jgi:hypothetical protein
MLRFSYACPVADMRINSKGRGGMTAKDKVIHFGLMFLAIALLGKVLDLESGRAYHE